MEVAKTKIRLMGKLCLEGKQHVLEGSKSFQGRTKVAVIRPKSLFSGGRNLKTKGNSCAKDLLLKDALNFLMTRQTGTYGQSEISFHV